MFRNCAKLKRDSTWPSDDEDSEQELEEEMAKKSDVLSPTNPMFEDLTVSSKITTLVKELQIIKVCF